LAPKHHELLLRLMYCSVSAAEMTPQVLDQIFDAGTRNNQRHNITGSLISNGRLNMHFLEGPETAVRALWEKIQSDTRHHSIVQIFEQKLQGPRLFPKWALLRGQASKQEMLAMVRCAYLSADAAAWPEWSHSIGPLMILLDGEFGHMYSGDDPDGESAVGTHST
jgi:hypothetical protein